MHQKLDSSVVERVLRDCETKPGYEDTLTEALDEFLSEEGLDIANMELEEKVTLAFCSDVERLKRWANFLILQMKRLQQGSQWLQ